MDTTGVQFSVVAIKLIDRQCGLGVIAERPSTTGVIELKCFPLSKVIIYLFPLLKLNIVK